VVNLGIAFAKIPVVCLEIKSACLHLTEETPSVVPSKNLDLRNSQATLSLPVDDKKPPLVPLEPRQFLVDVRGWR